jgi:hypothetical protein
VEADGMNVLIVGTGGNGSWEIRGEQLGGAMGARVTSNPSDIDWAWADLVVLVKRAVALFGARARKAGKPVVWDALDFWTQPSQNQVGADEAVRLAGLMSAEAKPVLTIGATQAMADALGGVYLPHHAWPGMAATPARETCAVVAYQGNAAYLGRWAGWLSDACQARGWRLVVNPSSLQEADILVALRDGEWDGRICREWKSGVKVVNAIVAGRPVITQYTAAWRELRPLGTVVESQRDLDAALDIWAPYAARAAAVDVSTQSAGQFTLNTVAATYLARLEAVACLA